uniref:ATP synthase subunit a n=1 Tax=Meteorus pulchricornis TaxID=51522 RepID=D8WHE1_9HYME|nr:ATP synthase F0 subunit 6 [Meteorus pulchricornis]ACY09464.1 ATP synthase F0 subunit 6 [Meteorus pulchricornis]QHS69754.1 ATP synthase F0 subunit 6 [Meteorus pulchricornis]WCB99546.1 ATP synthase F0 subunit 6 [Meteorus pulchricornis]
MLNLFSVFDPYMGYLFLNWFSLMLYLLLFPQIYWFYNSRFFNLIKLILVGLWMEFKLIIYSKFNLMNLLLLISLFMFILYNNFMGLFPYIFTSSSHLMFSLFLSLSMWMGMMFFGWLKKTEHMFIHLVPMGTPFVLMFFMVLIESLSNLIRPLTLSIRLVANMIAGHLLLTLLSSFIPSVLIMYVMFLLVQLLLLALEMAVSVIQSYVFVVLMILYLKETN